MGTASKLFLQVDIIYKNPENNDISSVSRSIAFTDLINNKLLRAIIENEEKCTVCDLHLMGRKYFLNNGKWYA